MRAALLLRVSSKDQEKGYSLATQQADCRAYCERKGYEVVAVYDDTRSGALLIDARPGAMKLLEDAKVGRFDVVVVWKYDRAFRDAEGLPWFTYELRRAGVNAVESVNDHIPEGRFRNVFLSLTGDQASQEREDIRLRSIAGVRARVEKGGKLIPSTRPRFGYLWNDPGPRQKGSYVENPETSWIVRLIYERIAAGTPVKTLCRELERRGIPAPKGGERWGTFTLSNLVRCEMYKGEAFAYVAKTEARGDGRRKRTVRPVEDRVPLPEGTVPSLVDLALWQAANDRLGATNRSTRYAPGEDPEDVLVRGLVRCACGYRMHIKRLADGPYLNCQARARRANDCPGNMIRAATLDRATWDRVRWILSDPSVVMSQMERERQTEYATEDTTALDRQIREVERRIGHLTDAIAEGGTRSLVEKLRTLEAERDALEQRKAEVEEQHRLLERQANAVRSWADLLLETDGNLQTMGYADRRERLRRLGIEVTVDYKGSERPRYEVAMSVPVPADDLWFGTEPRYLSAEEDAEAERQTAHWEATRSAAGPGSAGKRGTLPGGNTRSAPCADTAGGTPRRSRTARLGRSPS